jgi:2-oxoglutarate dehydrogenase E1 component
VYAALHKHREAQGIKNTAITRIEQLHPFPWAQLKENLNQYPNAKTIVWCQEEPINGGAWSFVQPRIQTLMKEIQHSSGFDVLYAGRDPSASVAAGLKSSHDLEEDILLKEAFNIRQDGLKRE